MATEPRLTQVQLRVSVAGVLVVPDAETTARVAAWVRGVQQRRPEATFDVRIQTHRKRRTLKQNAKLHAMLTDILDAVAAETGNSFDDCKLGVKWSAVQRRGYPTRPVPLVEGKTEPLPSHLATTEQMGLLIDEAYQVAAEHGVVLA